ncbi:daf-12-interacting protein 1-like isoform X2 [Penaeus chinensis]|uniref:daf-12-interacting protein 1-like isoform X2 n=1 Tax=Penaeus chinensis TaxID=139456 RepID=UPI001FB6E245|nr:daf-12-interacting protein 1-like isoform X2 [Penaeus chinensis]
MGHILMVVSATMLSLTPMTTPTITPTTIPSTHTPASTTISTPRLTSSPFFSSSFTTTPISPTSTVSTSMPAKTPASRRPPMTPSRRRRTPPGRPTPAGTARRPPSTPAAAAGTGTSTPALLPSPTGMLTFTDLADTRTPALRARNPTAPTTGAPSLPRTPTLTRKTHPNTTSTVRHTPTRAWPAPTALPRTPSRPAADARPKTAHTDPQRPPPTARTATPKNANAARTTPTDALYLPEKPPKAHHARTPTHTPMPEPRPRRHHRHRLARMPPISAASSPSAAAARKRLPPTPRPPIEPTRRRKDTAARMGPSRRQHTDNNHKEIPASSSSSFTSSPTLIDPIPSSLSSLSSQKAWLPPAVEVNWKSEKTVDVVGQTKLSWREVQREEKENSTIHDNFTHKSKSYRYGSRNNSSSKAKTSEFTLRSIDYKLNIRENETPLDSNPMKRRFIDAKTFARTFGGFDESDINNNFEKRNIEKRNAREKQDTGKDEEENLENLTEKNILVGSKQNQASDEDTQNPGIATTALNDTRISGEEERVDNENAGEERITEKKHKKRRRRRRGRGRGRRRGPRRRNDLSLWIDRRQVKMFSGKEKGYVMEIFAIHDGHVLPYILDPNFEKHLPVIPSEVESVNFTWQAGRKRYDYTFDRLYSQDEDILHAPVVSMATHGRIPKKPKVFTINIQCTGNASGVATFGIGLLIQSMKGKPLPGTPLRLQLRKECTQHGPDPECDQKCENGGVCDVDQRCLCPEGYMGQYCNTALCYPQCMNGGTCTTPGRCSCPPGFQGRHCEGGICRDKCENGGKCVQKDTCECPRGYYGNRCEFSKCVIPCINGGRCRDVNKCRCPHGFAGDHCEIVMGQLGTDALNNSRCSRKCKYGTCNGSMCECELGYSGRWCRRRSGKTVRRRIWL